jgi:TRAP transporter 4TM/12TM fusion protein
LCGSEKSQTCVNTGSLLEKCSKGSAKNFFKKNKCLKSLNLIFSTVKDGLKPKDVTLQQPEKEPVALGEISRFRYIPAPARVIFVVFSFTGIGIAVIRIFNITIAGQVMLNYAYYYLLFALFLSLAYLMLPMRKKDKTRLPWYDCVLAAATFGIPFYFFTKSWEIVTEGWYPATTPQTILAIIFLLLLVEIGRRAAGTIFLAIVIIMGLYPLYADYMPGVFWGNSHPFLKMTALYVFGEEGLLGPLARVLGDILIGFLLFAGMLLASGAGDFFLKFAFALLGRYRGGPAKVAVVSSGVFGMLSGSGVTNVVATGSITIPAMKKLGFPPHYAGAIEAVASAGGMFMPPIMGAAAFVMCELLQIPYSTVIVAAALPASLYYLGLLLQVDAAAARIGLRGMPREEIPSMRTTLKQGWPFIFVILFLIWGLIFMRWEALAPFYASALMFILSFLRRETMLTPRRLVSAFVRIGNLIASATAILMPLSLVVGGLVITGVALSFSSGAVRLGGESAILIIFIGIVACYIMGMAGLVTPAYIFLAITMAPPIVRIGGLNEIAVHLFLIYYAMLALITPPVCAGAIMGATIAGAPPMKTGFQAMRLGAVIYFLPFFFLFHPALILQGASLLESMYLYLLCVLGILFIAAGMEGYLLKLGKVRLWMRPLLVVAGGLIAYPEWNTTLIGLALAALSVGIMLISKRMVPEELPASK